MGYKREAAGLPGRRKREGRNKFRPIRIGGVAAFRVIRCRSGFSDLSEGGYGRFAY